MPNRPASESRDAWRPRPRGAVTGCSLENRSEPGQHFIHDRGGNALQSPGAASAEIERAGLIAADHSRGSQSGAAQRNGEPGCPREGASAGDGKNHWHFDYVVERFRRDDQDRAAALLLMSLGGVEPDQPDLTTL
jgi:hypothetical protein